MAEKYIFRNWHLKASKRMLCSQRPLSEENDGESIQSWKQINDLGTIVNWAFTLSINFLTDVLHEKAIHFSIPR